MTGTLIAVVTILTADYVLTVVADWLNARHSQPEVPAEFREVFDADRYRRSQEYLQTHVRAGMLQHTAHFAITLAFLLAGGFRALDDLVRTPGLGPIWTGLLYAGSLLLGSRLIQLPFTLWDTFVIEARFGFNRTTPRTFLFDLLKGIALLILLGAPLYAAVLWFFEFAGPHAWLWAWTAITAFQLLAVTLAPILIMPLFNRYTPLPPGELRDRLEAYARDQRFTMRGIFTMDGSRRSTRTNAFFTGLGRWRRIVLFDTLIARHPTAELLAVVAHEMGHFKRGHIPQAMLRSILQTGLVLFLMSRIMLSPDLASAFGLAAPSIYTGLVFFGFLYTPLALLLGLWEHAIARRHEFEADAFAAATLEDGAAAMQQALKRLSADNLSNLTPHPLKVALSYHHPPVLERVRALSRPPVAKSASAPRSPPAPR